MSPITFKFFTPCGVCRRVSSEGIPEFDAIDKLVDGMVEGPHCLSYKDSEGDAVLLKTTQDVIEAVKDAKDSGAKSIRVQIRPVQECPRDKEASATTASNCKGNNRNHCGGAGRRSNCHRWGTPQWGRCWSRGLFGYPHQIRVDLESVSDEVEETLMHFAPFFGIHLNKDAARTDKAKNKKDEPVVAAGSESHPTKENKHSQPQEVAKQVDETPKAESVTSTPIDKAPDGTPSPVPTIEEGVEAENREVSAAGFTFVETDAEDDEGARKSEDKIKGNEDKPTPDFAMDEKLKLLKEMGFEIPHDVARNMIMELNGRMDLIVRALVANQK